jgi:hypothetical protein
MQAGDQCNHWQWDDRVEFSNALQDHEDCPDGGMLRRVIYTDVRVDVNGPEMDDSSTASIPCRTPTGST